MCELLMLLWNIKYEWTCDFITEHELCVNFGHYYEILNMGELLGVEYIMVKDLPQTWRGGAGAGAGQDQYFWDV